MVFLVVRKYGRVRGYTQFLHFPHFTSSVLIKTLTVLLYHFSRDIEKKKRIIWWYLYLCVPRKKFRVWSIIKFFQPILINFGLFYFWWILVLNVNKRNQNVSPQKELYFIFIGFSIVFVTKFIFIYFGPKFFFSFYLPFHFN